MKNSMRKIVVLGPEGTYSSKAVQFLQRKYNVEYAPTILACGMALNQMTDALMPLENTLDGFIMDTLDAFMKNPFYIQEQVKLPIGFHFASHATSIEQVQKVYVQHKAYGQCLNFISKYQLTPYITQSNMESLELLKKNPQSDIGAIVPSFVDVQKFNLYELNVADSMKNETRFVRVCLKNEIECQNELLRISVMLYPLTDRFGLLYSILEVFKRYQINLKAILSRPKKDKIGNYVFYVEFEMKKEDLDLISKIEKELQRENVDMKCIGIYNELEE